MVQVDVVDGIARVRVRVRVKVKSRVRIRVGSVFGKMVTTGVESSSSRVGSGLRIDLG